MLWPGPSVFAQSMDRCWLTLAATPALLRPGQKGCPLFITFRGTNPTLCLRLLLIRCSGHNCCNRPELAPTFSSFLLLPVCDYCDAVRISAPSMLYPDVTSSRSVLIPYHISSHHAHSKYDYIISSHNHNGNLSATWAKSVLMCMFQTIVILFAPSTT